jgi:hypothetical protein
MKIRLIGSGECLCVGALGLSKSASDLLNHHVMRTAKELGREHAERDASRFRAETVTGWKVSWKLD